MNSSNVQVQLVKRPAGQVREDDFRIVSVARQQPGNGEVLIESLWLSLDPYMRLRMDDRESYAPPVPLGAPMVGGGVGRVLASGDATFAVGDLVEGRIGWQSHPLARATELRRLDRETSTEDARHALGLFGMPSLTAYCGLLDIGQPSAGETVVVGAATGAVGSVVGQIARLTGCRVVGVAGGESKCRTAIDEGGFDACIDHRSPNLTRDLAAACPEGVDVYFENIGGNVLAAVLPLLNLHARIPLCGLLAQYNGDQVHAAPNLLPGFLDSILTRRLSVRGFIISDLMSRRPAFEAEMRRWVAEGRIRYREDITQGLENAPLAFLRMLGGHNLGKTLVQVS